MLNELVVYLHAAGNSPIFQVFAIIIATFILEDAATVLTAIEVQSGLIALPVALGALYAGIILGDIGLYGLGMAGARWPRARRWVNLPEGERRAEWMRAHVMRAVFISRFIPGARLPVYTACGFFRAGLARFTLATSVATLIWTSALFAVSLRIGAVILTHLGAWRWVGAAGFVLTIIVIGRFAAHLQKRNS